MCKMSRTSRNRQTRLQTIVASNRGGRYRTTHACAPTTGACSPAVPYRLNRAQQLLGLVHQKQQHHHHSKDYREIVHAMAVVVLEVIALIFQRIECLIFNLPPRPSSAHQGIDVALAHPQVRHPTKVLDSVSAHLPVLNEINPYCRVRLIEGHIIDKAKPMHQTGGTVVSFIRGHAPDVFCCLDCWNREA